MKKCFLWIILILVIVIGVYYILGLNNVVPLYHCDSTMGPNGIIEFCEWYRGPEPIY